MEKRNIMKQMELQCVEDHDKGLQENMVWLSGAMAYAKIKIDENMPVFQKSFPAPSSENLIYPQWENMEWTPGFWTGMLWLMYEETGDKIYRERLEGLIDTFRKRLDEDTTLETHDIGFLYSLSTLTGYRLLGRQDYLDLSVRAANRLMDRYHHKAQIIQAWGDLNNPAQQGRMIIDCLLNLPLLYKISAITGEKRYYEAAYRHGKQAQKYLVREDGSTYHTYYMDIHTGEPIKGTTAQGYSDQSTWARGQAWAVYGFTLSYLYTGDVSFVETAVRTADYYMDRLPPDLIPYWDLYFTEGDEYRDSSAAGILACGLLELAKQLPLSDQRKKVYEETAVSMVRSLADSYTTKGLKSNGIINHGVYSIPHGNGVDECCIWGDYYYLEALTRLKRTWNLYW